MNSFVLDSDKQFFDGLSKVENCPTKKYHQVFKYAVGGFFKKGNVDILKNADDLYNLDNALHKRKMIQGYGAFRKLVPKIKYISKNSIKTDNEKE